ncbi:MAG: hypothetical protein ABIK65_10310 [Candidatus Eisenbacteria bacterium]
MATKTGRLKKKQLKEDQFVTTTFQMAGYFQHHRTQVMLAVAGALFLALVFVLFVRFQASSRRGTEFALSEGVGLFQAGNYTDAAYRLSTFLQSHSGHKDAGYAALLCGDANFYLSRWEDAGRYYRTALEKSKEGTEIWLGARAGLASVEEGLGRSVEAARIYEDLAGMHENKTAKAHMLFSAVRAYGQGGDYSKANALLERIDEASLDPLDLANLERIRTEIDFNLSQGGKIAATP